MKKLCAFVIILLLASCTARIGDNNKLSNERRMPLIPYPANVQWGNGSFNLKKSGGINITSAELKGIASLFRTDLKKLGISLSVTNGNSAEATISFKLNPEITGAETYNLEVSTDHITIAASTPHGIFNGVQTLKQLIRPDNKIDACTISDQPAFAVRGYLIDVGRNYQSIPLIKQQIDVLAAYKLNMLHFHATEDVAWRFESKKFPQLTAPENMLRDKGKYYSEAEIKDLIKYCEDRFITFLPEIDMPGHSAAFKRALGADMQSAEGMAYLKDILNEFIDTYKPKLLHFGGDEVKITNQKFLPEMTALVHSKGVKTMGWSPGGNIGSETIRQLWMDDKGHKETSTMQFIDSRHLYINHMDPLESVTTIFNRQIGDVDKGNASMLGAILCNWPDRKVEFEDDPIKKSPAYPALLAFSERTWRGGGVKGWKANIGKPGEERTANFSEFENRLLAHKSRYFQDKPFPYSRQQDLVWNLYGPYGNGGNLEKTFAPESNLADLKPYGQQVGGTVILRHWWYPLIEGVLDSAAKENETWYASTKIYSERSGEKEFWIGFNNLSRSPNPDTPPAGEWDYKKSKIWVNGAPISAPQWKNAGKTGNPEVPLTDEGYEYRKPTRIYLKKGWNDVLIKAPVGSFQGKNWHNPVKWMFSFVPAG